MGPYREKIEKEIEKESKMKKMVDKLVSWNQNKKFKLATSLLAMNLSIMLSIICFPMGNQQSETFTARISIGSSIDFMILTIVFAIRSLAVATE